MRTARVDLTGAKSPTVIIAVPDKFPAVIVARPDTPQRKATFWSSALDYLIESFALYGAALCGVAMHPVALFAVEPACGEETTFAAERYRSPSERREVTSLISPADRTRHHPSLTRQSNHVTPAGYVIALSRRQFA